MFSVAIVGSTILLMTTIFLMCLMVETLSGEKLASDSKRLNLSAAVGLDEAYSFAFSNKTGHNEVIFRQLTDGINTLTSKLSLPNTIGSDSRKFETLVANKNIVISWWDQNVTSDQANGVTLGVILLKLPNENITRLYSK